MPLPRKSKKEAYQCHVGDTIKLGKIKVKLDQSLGKGSFGEVFKGKHSKGEIVAVKQLNIEGEETQGKIAKKELDNFQKIQDHPNLVKLLDHHFARSSIWLVMEFCDLGNLDEFFLAQKPDFKTKVRMMRQIARGLAHMHTQASPVIHRDIKPANILMTSVQGEPTAKIADFSLSKFKDPSRTLETYTMSTQGGTMTFMAPEGSMYERNIPIGSTMCNMMKFQGTVDPVCITTTDVSSPTETAVKVLIAKMTCVKGDERLTACQVRDVLEDLDDGNSYQQAEEPDDYEHYLVEEKQAGVGQDMITPENVQGVHSSAPQPGSENYQLVDFNFPIGPIFNFVSAVITTPTGLTAYPKIDNNCVGTVKICYQPIEVGLHEMVVAYNNQPIQGSPFKFHVDSIHSGFVTAYGPGLTHGYVGLPGNFTIVTKDAGEGVLALEVEGPSKTEINSRENKDGTCSASYFPTVPGEYNILIRFADKHISGSPFTAKISGPDGNSYQQDYESLRSTVVNEDWFHGFLPRYEAERLLKTDGDYLVRESENKKTQGSQYVLSVMWQGHKHFKIQGAEGGWKFEGNAFPTIQALLAHNLESKEPVTHRTQAKLKNVILRGDWDLKNDDIKLMKKIGNGHFGDVHVGNYIPKNLEVAVKTCSETLGEDAKKKFLQEGKILMQYDHPNIVRFIGIAAQRQPIMIVMEYVPGGALSSFLRKEGKNQSVQQLTKMCKDTSAGMAYLEEKKCIHRDLAARNCLVGDRNVIKISDFGMSREKEEYTMSKQAIQIKWTAPEALHYREYTSASDVWSYGILMWEIFSLGATPYQEMSNKKAFEKVDLGYRMPAPESTPTLVIKLMNRCWQMEPENRPKFDEIHWHMLNLHP